MTLQAEAQKGIFSFFFPTNHLNLDNSYQLVLRDKTEQKPPPPNSNKTRAALNIKV
jgi:hypothetical protein